LRNMTNLHWVICCPAAAVGRQHGIPSFLPVEDHNAPIRNGVHQRPLWVIGYVNVC
jgi:hypothetical protein